MSVVHECQGLGNNFNITPSQLWFLETGGRDEPIARPLLDRSSKRHD